MSTRTRRHAIGSVSFTAVAAAALSVAMLALMACSSPERDVLLLPTAPTSTVPLGSDFTLAPGESVVLGSQGSTVVFTGVVNESRCPTNALIQCVWAGSATIALRVNEGGSSRTITLETLPTRNSTPVGRFQVLLVDVTPAPVTLDSIPPATYRAVLRINDR